MILTLQIKDAGAWRNMVRFENVNVGPVLEGAADLLRSLQCARTVMRVMAGDKQMYICSAPTFVWMPSEELAGRGPGDDIAHTICTICDGSGTWEGKACVCRVDGS